MNFMEKKKKIGLFFGTFNPVHIGHMAIANYFVAYSDLDQLWFVVSPHNPLKNRNDLLADYHRLHLLELAIGDSNLFRVSNVEFNMPKPSYTIDTLTYLHEKYPDYELVLLLGSDNLDSFHKWKNYQVILDQYQLYVYPRNQFKPEDSVYREHIKLVDAPQMEVSSSFIRKAIREGKDVSFFMPESVARYVNEMNFYQ